MGARIQVTGRTKAALDSARDSLALKTSTLPIHALCSASSGSMPRSVKSAVKRETPFHDQNAAPEDSPRKAIPTCQEFSANDRQVT
ncbi:hypothetical protein ACMHYB_01480 [Sorangium sp. So ce1128]